jgi:hypothetical protein
MRRACVAIVTGVLVLVASGCGGDAADPTATATSAPVAAATATTPPAPIPTATESAEPTATPPPPVTATATLPPATVVAPPRPVATRPPLQLPQATPASPSNAVATATKSALDIATATVPPTTPTTATQGQPTPTTASQPTPSRDLVILFDEGFDASTTLTTGTTQQGSATGLESGFYYIVTPHPVTQTVMVKGQDAPVNGVMHTVVAVDGDGWTGLYGRRSAGNGFGAENLYVCWINEEGAAGCDIRIEFDYTPLLYVPPGTVPFDVVNELLMVIDGDQIYFEVNGVAVGTATDGRLTGGSWGLYNVSNAGNFSALFDSVTLAAIVDL